MLTITERTINNQTILPKGQYGETIKAIFTYLGGIGLSSAIAWTGGHNLSKAERADNGRPDPSFVDDKGIHFQTGVRFQVNGKPGQTWIMFVTYESNDTFTVRLAWVYGPVNHLSTGKWGEILDEASNVYDDNLKAVVEQMYDTQITKHHGGIPI